MKHSLIFRNILFGFLSWVVPFIVSIAFYRPGGVLIVPHDLFKSVMIVVGSFNGCYFLYLYFNQVQSHFVLQGFIVGLTWLAINIILDALILLPMMKVSFADYFMSIGMQYFIIPAMSITMGLIADKKIAH